MSIGWYTVMYMLLSQRVWQHGKRVGKETRNPRKYLEKFIILVIGMHILKVLFCVLFFYRKSSFHSITSRTQMIIIFLFILSFQIGGSEWKKLVPVWTNDLLARHFSPSAWKTINTEASGWLLSHCLLFISYDSKDNCRSLDEKKSREKTVSEPSTFLSCCSVLLSGKEGRRNWDERRSIGTTSYAPSAELRLTRRK